MIASSELVTLANFQIAWIPACKRKPILETLISVMDILFKNYKEKTKNDILQKRKIFN